MTLYIYYVWTIGHVTIYIFYGGSVLLVRCGDLGDLGVLLVLQLGGHVLHRLTASHLVLFPAPVGVLFSAGPGWCLMGLLPSSLWGWKKQPASEQGPTVQ